MEKEGYSCNECKSVEQQAAFMELLKTAYDEDLGLIISCVYLHDDQLARQTYLHLAGNRFMICYTSQVHAEREAMVPATVTKSI